VLRGLLPGACAVTEPVRPFEDYCPAQQQDFGKAEACLTRMLEGYRSGADSGPCRAEWWGPASHTSRRTRRCQERQPQHCGTCPRHAHAQHRGGGRMGCAPEPVQRK
jgi:hypothetical protein